MGYLINKVITAWWTSFYYALGKLFFSDMGKGCRFEGWIDLPQRGRKIRLGDHVHICRRVTITVTHDGELTIGNNVFIGPGVVISSHQRIVIGDDSLIAEYVSIYDNDHGTAELAKPISTQGYVSEPCEIGAGCWVGAGSKILRGGGLGRDCILGAGAVLKKVLPDASVAVGVPARVVKNRATINNATSQVP